MHWLLRSKDKSKYKNYRHRELFLHQALRWSANRRGSTLCPRPRVVHCVFLG